MSDQQRMIIDTDTASDDAVAILMALQWPAAQVEAITVVFGNVPVEQGSMNARYTVELCEANTPVYEGIRKPLLREPHFAYFFHGPDGMGDMQYPAPQQPVGEGDAVSQLIHRFRRSPGQITLVTLGPLTNIAAALALEPDLAGWVKECYVMGGAACTVGNITPTAEYNIWCDPEAARIVFRSGMKLTMVGWELCRGEANLDDAELEQIHGFNTDRASFVVDCNRQALKSNRAWLGDPGLPLPDPVTLAIALNPAVCTRRSAHYVDISCDEALTRGMTVVDQLGVTKQPPNVDVCWEIDVPLWKETLYRTLR